MGTDVGTDMLTTVLDTAGIPPADRTQVWAETTGLAMVATHISFGTEPERVAARIQVLGLGPVRLSAISYTPLSSQRTPRLIRRSDPELYQLALTATGRQTIEQGRAYAALGPGDLVLYDSSRPFTATSGPHGDGTRALVLQFPRALLPLPDNAVAPLCGTPLDGGAGVGRLLSDLLTGLVEAQADLDPGDLARLGSTVVDLAAAVLAHHCGRQVPLPDDSRRRVLYEQACAYITGHLHDPGLGPVMVASAHFISTRYLHRIFQQHGTTVGDFVRRSRLARCRRDLSDPAQHAVPVGAIGVRWGYPTPSAFTRAFRTAMGVTPSEFRARAGSRP